MKMKVGLNVTLQAPRPAPGTEVAEEELEGTGVSVRWAGGKLPKPTSTLTGEQQRWVSGGQSQVSWLQLNQLTPAIRLFVTAI